MAAEIVYADERLVAVNKPPGVSLATGRALPHAAVARLLAAVPARACRELGLAPDELHLVHRLDVGTSGLVLLARDPDAHRALAGAFASRQVTKLYLALVWGAPRPPRGRYEWPLGPDRRDRRRMRVAADGRQAATSYLRLARARYAALLVLQPATGRTHQIRVHLAHAGHPIVGDDLYAGPRHHAVRGERLRAALAPGHPLLHAWRLALPATAASPELVLTAEPPADFAGTLAALGVAPAVLDTAPERLG